MLERLMDAEEAEAYCDEVCWRAEVATPLPCETLTGDFMANCGDDDCCSMCTAHKQGREEVAG